MIGDGAQAGTADPSGMDYLWSAKEMETWKLSLGVTKRTNKMYLSYINPTTYVQCPVLLQANEEKARCKNKCTKCIEMTSSEF